MNRKLNLVILVILMCLLSHNLTGQKKIDGFSLSPKIGAYTTIGIDQMGFIAGAKANLMQNKFLYSLNYYYADEYILIGTSGPDRYFNQAALMFGRYKLLKSFRMEYQGGIATLWGIKYGEHHYTGFLEGYYDTEDFTILGFITEIGMEYIASKHFSLGTHLILNVNSEKSLLEFMLSFSFGKFEKPVKNH
jgi:hypothetical protein